MPCWRRSWTEQARHPAPSSSNGALSMRCAPCWVGSRRRYFSGRAFLISFNLGLRKARSPSMSSAPSDQTGLRYAYKASLIGSAHQFELTEQGLSWRIAGRSGLWPYADIAIVRLSYRPVSMQSRRFRADVGNADGARIVILSTSWQTAALMAPQDRDYRAFVTQLHARMASAGSRAALVGGLGPRV